MGSGRQYDEKFKMEASDFFAASRQKYVKEKLFIEKFLGENSNVQISLQQN